jgi:enamine deaminase RidA (YjgF/YER057c/UK114 family)
MKIINPESFAPPVGYANAIETRGGRTIYLAGQTAMNEQGIVQHKGDLVRQFQKVLMNLQEVMRTAGGDMTDIVRLLIFVKNKRSYKEHLKELGGVYRSFFGKHYPAMSLVQVADLYDDDALIEIEGIAVIDR